MHRNRRGLERSRPRPGRRRLRGLLSLETHYEVPNVGAQTTTRRADAVRMAIAAGKHVYCEKPAATNLAEALELARLARERGVKNGVVQDKLFLPGLIKLKRLLDSGFFGRILSVRGEFGYWVFEGAKGVQLAELALESWKERRWIGAGTHLCSKSWGLRA